MVCIPSHAANSETLEGHPGPAGPKACVIAPAPWSSGCGWLSNEITSQHSSAVMSMEKPVTIQQTLGGQNQLIRTFAPQGAHSLGWCEADSQAISGRPMYDWRSDSALNPA